MQLISGLAQHGGGQAGRGLVTRRSSRSAAPIPANTVSVDAFPLS